MSSRQEKIPILVYTDDGRDVDDIEAITYLAGSPNADIVGVVTTHMIPDRRAFIARAVLSHLGYPASTPVGVGSVFPIGQEDEKLVRYLRTHTVDSRTYEGDGMIECFPDAVDIIHETIDKYGKDLRIAVLAPLTDLAKAARSDPGNFSRIGGLYMQGQATVTTEGVLVPDAAAYNFEEDMVAAAEVFSFQDRVPFTLLGKYAAYQLPLLRSDFDLFESTGHPVGKYLKIHKLKDLACFAERAPQIFQRVFGVSVEQIDELDKVGNPYDPLVAKAIANPEGMRARRIGNHALFGMVAEEHGILNPMAVKAEIMTTMMSALASRHGDSAAYSGNGAQSDRRTKI